MSDQLNYQYSDLWYIRLINETDKNPRDKWGGYAQDYAAAEHVYTHADVEAADCENWGIVGIKDKDRLERCLLIFDLDVHKAAAGDDTPKKIKVDDRVPLIKSQNGGFHVPFIVHGERGSYSVSDFEVTKDLTWDIDIRGSAVSHHVVAPADIPGIGGRYELVKDGEIPTVFDPADAVERITLDGEPVVSYQPNRGVQGDWSLDRDVDPPAEMPRCYHAGLQLRKANPDDHPDTHKVNTLTALCGLAAGYSVDEMTEHFCDDYAPGENADRGKTRYHLEHMERKMANGRLSPPAPSTLREWGILGDNETCGCEIEYHGGSSQASNLVSDDSWDGVKSEYANNGKGAGRRAAANKLEDVTPWMYVMESETLWVYDEDTGYFNPWGEEYAGRLLERNLASQYSTRECNEILDRLKKRNQTRRREINARNRDGVFLCVGNGVVDLETGRRLDHDPEYKFTRGLQWDYDPARADPQPVVEFLDDITERETDRDTLLDHLAHGLMPGHPFRAFIITYGPGSNGKTELGKLLRGFVGEENAASVELQDLTGDDNFATGALPGAFVNIGDDVSKGELRDVSILKSLTGGGTIRANRKYEKKYDFQNEAAMFFSANEPPRITEESEAIGDRLYPIEMPYRFLSEDDGDYNPENPYHKVKTPGKAQDLIENGAAMRGLLLLAVKHAQDLIERKGRYSMPEGPRERRRMYEAAADPIARFAIEYLEPGKQSDAILKDDAYSVYTRMCQRDDERIAGEDGFKRAITRQAAVDLESSTTRALTPGESQDTCWRYVTFTEDARDLMPYRLISRYFELEDEEPVTEEDDDPAFGAVPIVKAAESLTGYVAVTALVATTRRLGEDEAGLKVVLKDESTAIDLVTWDASIATSLEALEGEYVAVRDAEVTEYEGKRQLSPVENVTEFTTIQPGVGYTESQASGDNAELSAAADGGEVTQEERLRSVKALIAECEAESSEAGAPVDSVVDRARALGLDREQVEHDIEKLKQASELSEPALGYLRVV